MPLLRTLAILAAVLVSSSANVAAPPGGGKDEAIRAKIERFLNDPLEGHKKGDVEAIRKFSDEHKDITVVIAGDTCEWMMSGIPDEAKLLLLTAFIAGNVRSQLDTGTYHEDTYSGTVQVLRVYRLLKSLDPKYKDAGLEKFLEMQSKGELNRHLLELTADDKSEDEDDGARPPKKKK